MNYIHTLSDGRTIDLGKIYRLSKIRCSKSKYKYESEDFAQWAIMRVLQFSSKLNKNAHLCNINWLFDEYLYKFHKDGSKVKNKIEKSFTEIQDYHIKIKYDFTQNLESPIISTKKTIIKEKVRQFINEESCKNKIKECSTVSRLKAKYPSIEGFLRKNLLLDKYYPDRKPMIPIKIRNIKNNEIYDSINHCAKTLNISAGNISKHLKGKLKTVGKTKLEVII